MGIEMLALAISAFSGGAVLGWVLGQRRDGPPPAMGTGEPAPREVRERQEALERLMSYSADQAYGMGGEGA